MTPDPSRFALLDTPAERGGVRYICGLHFAVIGKPLDWQELLILNLSAPAAKPSLASAHASILAPSAAPRTRSLCQLLLAS